MAEALKPPLPSILDNLAERVLRLASARDLTIATAESCTGGMLASLLTDLPGLSHAFDRGFVVYTEDAKHELLGVPYDLLQTDGAVSEACARAMAQGALERSAARLSVAITGFAEGGPEQPAGLVHLACGARGADVIWRRLDIGPAGRAAVRFAAIEAALRMLLGRLPSISDGV